MMVVSSHTEKQLRKLIEHIVKIISNVVIKLLGVGYRMHRNHRAHHTIGHSSQIILDETKIRSSLRVILFKSIRI